MVVLQSDVVKYVCFAYRQNGNCVLAIVWSDTMDGACHIDHTYRKQLLLSERVEF